MCKLGLLVMGYVRSNINLITLTHAHMQGQVDDDDDGFDDDDGSDGGRDDDD